MKMSQNGTINVTKLILLIGFIIGLIYTLYLFSSTDLTPRESTLLGTMLTICSTLASWMVTHIYADTQIRQAVEDVQERSQANLRTYALKASEKVNNLSNELHRLCIYLEDELNFNDYENIKESLNAREERIQSAVHIIRTLKSVNDTSLSDWEGVIGEELDQQREERREREDELVEVISRVEEIVEGQRQDFIGSQENTKTLRSEVQDIKRDLRSAISELGVPRLPTKVPRKPTRENIESKCPECSTIVNYRQRPKENSIVGVTCKNPNCSSKLLSKYTEDTGFVLNKRVIEDKEVTCPKCSNINLIAIDPLPGINVSKICDSCNCNFRVISNQKGILIRELPGDIPKTSEVHLAPEMLEIIKNKLPPQPWVKHIHKEVAESLGITPRIVSIAIQELIKQGVFNPQLHGIVYVPKE
jgi:phage FluMu protein Com